MTKGQHTKQSLAATAYTLLTRSGLHGTGLLELVEASGAPRGSIYHHFPNGKLEIVAAALELGRAHIRQAFENCFAGEASSAEKVLRLFKGTAKAMKADPTSVGCPVAAVTLDNFGGDESLRLQGESILADWRVAIAAGLIDQPAPQRAALAALILATYEGALISARAANDPSLLVLIGADLSRRVGAGIA